MKSPFWLTALLLLMNGSVWAAELPFDKPEEFPAKAFDLIADKRVVWLGEMHGSQEGPRLFLGLVRLISQHHKSPPVVAFEYCREDAVRHRAPQPYAASAAFRR